MSSSYNLYQQIYCLSSAANAVGNTNGTENDLITAEEVALATELPTIGNGNWKVSWGPRVYKSDPGNASTPPDNVWYCAVNDTLKMCVMAMAGTAFTSAYDWLKNGEVNWVIDFEPWTQIWQASGVSMPAQATVNSPDDPRSLIAWGTAQFTTNVLSTISPGGAVLPGTLVGPYLQSFQLQNPDYTIVFTGHSMGGAVCPAIALGLVQAGYINNANKNVWVVASAGPTPGSAGFNTAFSATFPPALTGSGYRVHNVDYWNTNDLVPQAWSTDTNDDRNLGNILTIYQSAKPKFYLETIIPAVAAAEFLPAINYHPIPGRSFAGPDVPPGIDSLATLEAAASDEHSPQYWKSIGILDWVDKYNKRLLVQPGVKPRAVQNAGAQPVTEVKAEDVKQPAQVDVKPLATV